VFGLCARHSILNISPYYFIFPQSCDSKNSCPDTTRKGPKSLEDLDSTAGLLKENIYFSLRLYHTVPHQTIHTEHQHPPGDTASWIEWIEFRLLRGVLDHVAVNFSMLHPCASEETFTFTAGAERPTEADCKVVFVSNESTLIRARPQCKLPWRFTDVAC